jgi:hypothetical protein
MDHDERLVLKRYIDPAYRREQLENSWADRRQFLDECRTGQEPLRQIVEMEFVCDDIRIYPRKATRPRTFRRPNVRSGDLPNGVRIEDTVFIISPRGHRIFAIDGPRG